MREARLFKNGQSQAVRLPKEFRFPGDSVFIKQHGEGVLLLPKHVDPWDTMLQGLNAFDPELTITREQEIPEDRPPLLVGGRRPRDQRRAR